MSFSLKSEEFQFVLNKLKTIASEGMESDNPDIKYWSKKIILIKFFFNQEMIDQLEENLNETRRWGLFNLENAYMDNKSNEIEFLKLSALNIFIYFKEAFFRLGKNDENISIRKFYDAIYDLKNIEYQKYKIYFDYIDELPYRICQGIYSDSKLNEIRTFLEEKDFTNFSDFALQSEKTFKEIQKWEESLIEKEEQVTRIQNSLDSYKDAFNFVGIFDGFNQLHEKKKNELFGARCGLVLMGVLILFAFAYELHSVGRVITEKNGMIDVPTLLAITIPFTLLAFLLLYFFKIILQTMRSIQSQLLQLDLRLTLCRFIQSYAESASELKKKHPEGFDKFEAIIFAPLVSSDEKIPNTFDGLDQLSSVVNIVKGRDS